MLPVRAIAALSLLSLLLTSAHAADACPARDACLASLTADPTIRSCTLPIPASSLPTPVRAIGYNLTELRPGVHSYFDGRYFALLLRSKHTLVVIDAPSSSGTRKPDGSGTRVTDAAKELLDGDVPRDIYLVLTHPHADHIGTSAAFFKYMRNNYPYATFHVVGTAKAQAHERLTTSGRYAVIDTLIPETGWELKLKGTDVRVVLKEISGHSDSDVLVHIPPTGSHGGVVHLVDFAFPGWAPFVYMSITPDMYAFMAAHETVLALEFQWFSGGHLTRLGGKEDVRVNLQYTKDLIAAAAKAIEETAFENFVPLFATIQKEDAPEFGNWWWALIAATDLRTAACYRTVVENWGCRLGGVGVTAWSHCFAANTFVSLET